MLGYVGQTESARKEHQQRLNEPPRVGVRDWSTEMPAATWGAFEAVAGDLLAELGYPVTERGRRPTRRPRDVPGGPAAWRGRRRRHAALAALAASPVTRRLRRPLVTPRYAAGRRAPRKATSIPFSEK